MEKFVTLRNADEVPMMKDTKSVRDVTVMPMPALANVAPRRSGTLITLSEMVSLQEDMRRNMSSTPMPVCKPVEQRVSLLQKT